MQLDDLFRPLRGNIMDNTNLNINLNILSQGDSPSDRLATSNAQLSGESLNPQGPNEALDGDASLECATDKKDEEPVPMIVDPIVVSTDSGTPLPSRKRCVETVVVPVPTVSQEEGDDEEDLPLATRIRVIGRRKKVVSEDREGTSSSDQKMRKVTPSPVESDSDDVVQVGGSTSSEGVRRAAREKKKKKVKISSSDTSPKIKKRKKTPPPLEERRATRLAEPNIGTIGLDALGAASLGAQAREWIDEVEDIRKRSPNIQGRLSGQMKLKLARIR